MARLLADANPDYRRKCRSAQRGCTCYRYAGTSTATKKLRRRAQRHTEARQVARDTKHLAATSHNRRTFTP
ncbi:hypothetical protein F4556_005103 [Kitasatospora gansuensis]|uniref:Uncharacterized protein n=1 Tax=Kitasatospora gansuensis TaxID=258050 RepID=A0A7W7SGL3_9ACTN|nr:hypothetical protein [Kitasatospora gansuensis]MBB4949568.1 hypothetical protein [Kitasatospora gansuensis]